MNTLIQNSPNIEVWTEGKTDWKLLKKAKEKLGIDLNIQFHESEGERGDSKLLTILQAYTERQNAIPLVFVFDHDVKNTINNVDDLTETYKNWGNNVFSFSIPIPPNREGLKTTCIELYFSDEIISSPDKGNRRLFLTSEFNPKSGKHVLDATISLGSRGILKQCSAENIRIIDSEVYDKEDKNIALTKSDFANRVCSDELKLDAKAFESFHEIFNILGKINQLSAPKCTICLPDLTQLLFEIRKIEDESKYEFLFNTITNVLQLALTLFVSTTIRTYEPIIIDESIQRKKIKPIVASLKEDFFQPSFKTLQELASYCIHLVSSSAPKDLVKMKACLENPFLLSDIGQLIDDLEKLFPPESKAPVIVNKPEIKKSIAHYIAPELANFSHLSQASFKNAIVSNTNRVLLDSTRWENALLMLIAKLQPIFDNIFVLKKLDKFDTNAQKYSVINKRYHGSKRHFSNISISLDEVERYQSNLSEMVLSDGTEVKLFPFAVIKDDSLFFYKRTQPNGYEYYSLKDNRITIHETKKKFNHSIFRIGSKQELFWTEALPVFNKLSGVRANIPTEGADGFIGRSEQKKSIFEEIIEIPNQNGIIFGPGGIGKTALLINISNHMFEASEDNVLFKNIIWISAKSDYYDYIFDVVEKRNPQFQSLETILYAILAFFSFENLDEYDFADKKQMVLEILEQHKILLIIDNLETVPRSEIDRIVKFFEVDIKRQLRQKPQNFKVIITSRKQIPSGFHQIPLKGLDSAESIMLIDKLFKNYRIAKTELTNNEKNRLHEATKGIPIVIKHCLSRIYEYNEPFNQVVMNLSDYESNLVQFSYKEILQEIEHDDKGEKALLKIVLLLNSVNRPLMIRQIADILELDAFVVEKAVPTLADYQCLRRINHDNQEKYYLNEEIRLLTASLATHHKDLVQDIRHKLNVNFSLDKQMDYTPEEKEITIIFQNYLNNGESLEAENYIVSQIKKKPDSILIKYHYAGFLVEQQKPNKAITILEEILEPSGNNSNVLKLLFRCYISVEVIDFNKVKSHADQLEVSMGETEEIRLMLAEFYIKWATHILKLPIKIDPLEEISRNGKIKTFSSKALKIMDKTTTRTPSTYYLWSQGYYNVSDYDSSLRMINNAIKSSVKGGKDCPQTFIAFRDIVLKRLEAPKRK